MLHEALDYPFQEILWKMLENSMIPLIFIERKSEKFKIFQLESYRNL